MDCFENVTQENGANERILMGDLGFRSRAVEHINLIERCEDAVRENEVSSVDPLLSIHRHPFSNA